MDNLRILVEQLNSIRGPRYNIPIVEEALTEEFDIAIFPELFYSGYLLRDGIRFLTVDNEFIDKLKSQIGNRILIFGAPTYDNFLRNSAVIVTSNDVIFYNKMHLPNFGPFEEERFFKNGTKPLSFAFKNFKINVQICYDIFFNDTVVQGSDIIVNISASPFTSKEHFEKIFASLALRNQSYVVYVNTAGLQRNLVFWGGSRIIDPDGNEVAKMEYFKEGRKYFDIRSDKLKISRMKRPILKEVLNEHQE